MNRTVNKVKHLWKQKLVTALCIGVSLAAFATLGDGGRRTTSIKGDANFLSLRSAPLDYKHFSLKSGYAFRGNSFLNTNATDKIITLNTVVTYQKGNATYILPLKKKLLMGKVTFIPSAPQH